MYSIPETLLSTITNGRTNYPFIEDTVATLFGWKPAERTGSAHMDGMGRLIEQKSYKDLTAYPLRFNKAGLPARDVFQVSPSSTFGANNHGKKIKTLLGEGNQEAVMELLSSLGYNHNTFYVLTNTGEFNPMTTPLNILVITTAELIKNLTPEDPRHVSRHSISGLVERTEVIDLSDHIGIITLRST